MSSNQQDIRRTFPSFTAGRRDQVLLALIILIYVSARLWRLSASCLWFDEVFSVHAARHNWLGMLKFAGADIIHPPLFYALLKIWIAVGGESVFWLRLLPFLFSVLAILPFLLICRELDLKWTERNLALLLMAISGFQIKYAQEVRMYSLLLFLSLLSIWLFIRILKSGPSRRIWLGMLAVNLLLVYTHYYGWMLIALQALVVIVWRRAVFRQLMFSTAALILAYVPWVYEVVVSRKAGRGLGQNLGWIARPRLRDIWQFFMIASKPFLFSQSTADRALDGLSGVLALLLFGIPLIIFFWKPLRSRAGRAEEAWLALFFLAPVLIAFLLSWILPYPIWGTRHLIICTSPFYLAIAMAILRLPRTISIAASLIIGCWFLFAGVVALTRPVQMFTWCSWEQLAQQLPADDGGVARTEIYAFEDLVAYHLWFAGTQNRNVPLRVTVIKGVMREDPAYFLPRRFGEIKTSDASQISGERIWLAFRAARGEEATAPLNLAQSLGYQRGRVLSMTAQGEKAFLVEFQKAR
jgi:uncharacterized membrane protein